MVADTSQGQALHFHYDGAQVEVPIEYTNPAEYAVTTDGNLREMEGGWVSLTVTRNGKPYANRQMVSVTPPTNAVVDTDMVTDTDGVFKSNSVNKKRPPIALSIGGGSFTEVAHCASGKGKGRASRETARGKRGGWRRVVGGRSSQL